MKPTPGKRLLIVSDFFYPHWTGISKSLLYLVTALGSRQPVSILTVRYSGRLPKKEFVGNAAVTRTPVSFSFSRTHFSFPFLQALPSSVSRADTVLINSPCTYVFPAALYAKLFRKRLIVFHQGDLILPSGILNRVIEKVFDVSTAVACRLADSVSTYNRDYAAQSRTLKPFLKKFTPLIIPVPVPSAGKRKNRIDTELAGMRRKKQIVFGFAGRFVEEKGFDILFRAIPRIMETLPQARFVFAGETRMGYEHFFDQKKRLWARVQPYVTRLGLLSGEELASFYRGIDFMIIPSRSDCFNLVQAETMLSGRPVISSNIPGLRVPVRETGFGMLFKKNDPDDLAAAVTVAVKKKASIMKMSKKAIDYYGSRKHSQTLTAFLGR